MLMHIDSAELAEWMAYEKHSGPINDLYTNEMLASLHELQQLSNRLAGAQFKKNPAPEPKAVPRPNEVLKAKEK